MPASITDKITDVRNAARPNSARATGTRSAAGVSLACDNLAGWPTASKVHFVTYQVDSSSNPVAGTQLDCSGIVSGNTIGSFTVIDGTDLGNSVGDYVEMIPTAAWAQDLADALASTHNRSGGLKTGLTIPSPTLTTPAIADFTSATHTHASNGQGGVLGFSALLSTIFSGQLTTYTNPGSAGGTNTFFYINLGGIKLFWGKTAAIATGSSYDITFPVGFFTTIQSIVLTAGGPTAGTNQIELVCTNLSTVTATITPTATTGSGTMVNQVLVVGS